MGKRELLLIVGFVVAGALVYQITAPPAAPGERSFSIGRIVDNIHRGIRGNRASGQATSTFTESVDGIEEIRFRVRSGDVTVTGEDRPDLSGELHVTSTGFDEAEAQRLALLTTLRFERGANTLVVTATYPEGGRQRANVLMKVPSRIRVRFDQPMGRTQISKVAEAELINSRGEAELRDITGRVTANHVGGTLLVSGAAAVKLTTRSTDLQVDRVLHEAAFTTRAGELKAGHIGGAIDVDATNTDVTLDTTQTAAGTLRVIAVNGHVAITGLRIDGRIEGRNAEIDVTVDRPAPLAIYSDGDEAVNLTPPASGYQLDAVASNGHITLADVELPVTTSGQEQRATGKVRGGGAAITIRNSRGDIKLRSRKSEG